MKSVGREGDSQTQHVHTQNGDSENDKSGLTFIWTSKVISNLNYLLKASDS